MMKELFSIQVSKVVHLITSTEFGRLSRRRGANHTYELVFLTTCHKIFNMKRTRVFEKNLQE
jgi:hypothetical protein